MESDINIKVSVSEQLDLLLKFHNLYFSKKKIRSRMYIGDVTSAAINHHIPMFRHQLSEEARAFLELIYPVEYRNNTPVQDPAMFTEEEDREFVNYMLVFDTDGLRNMYPNRITPIKASA